MDSFRNFMENNQYLEGGSKTIQRRPAGQTASPSSGLGSPTPSSVIRIPKIDELSNLKENARALVDEDKRLDGQDKVVLREITELKTRITNLERRTSNLEKVDHGSVKNKVDDLEKAVKEISDLLLILAN